MQQARTFQTFHKFFRNFYFFCDCYTTIEKFLINSVKCSTHKKCFQSFLHLFKLFPACFRIVQCFLQDFLGSELLQSPVRRNISELCLFWNYHGYSLICFTACLQLVKVSTVCVFLGRGLIVQESDSQEDQYLFEICLVEHSAQNHYQIAISCVSRFSKPVYSFSQLEVSILCCV